MLIKTLGYVISAVGILCLLLATITPLRTAIPIVPAQVSNNVLTLIGLVIAVAGILVAYKFSSGKKQFEEVPIYHEKKVVGYRRIHQK